MKSKKNKIIKSDEINRWMMIDNRQSFIHPNNGELVPIIESFYLVTKSMLYSIKKKSN